MDELAALFFDDVLDLDNEVAPNLWELGRRQAAVAYGVRTLRHDVREIRDIYKADLEGSLERTKFDREVLEEKSNELKLTVDAVESLTDRLGSMETQQKLLQEKQSTLHNHHQELKQEVQHNKDVSLKAIDTLVETDLELQEANSKYHLPMDEKVDYAFSGLGGFVLAASPTLQTNTPSLPAYTFIDFNELTTQDEDQNNRSLWNTIMASLSEVFFLFWHRLVSLSLQSVHKGPMAMLEADMSVGHCWPMAGQQGWAAIQLSQTLQVSLSLFFFF